MGCRPLVSMGIKYGLGFGGSVFQLGQFGDDDLPIGRGIPFYSDGLGGDVSSYFVDSSHLAQFALNCTQAAIAADVGHLESSVFGHFLLLIANLSGYHKA